MRIVHGLPPALRGSAAVLYWQAFADKLGVALGPERRALAYLERVMRADHALCAIDNDGTLLGVAGFKSVHGALVDGRFRDLRAVYGMAGACWRAVLFALLTRDTDNIRFLIDGIFVRPDARGHGIGTRLLLQLADMARSHGYAAMHLDVIDTNPRARALYQRLGFRAARTTSIGPLRLVFGFRQATTMVRNLSA